MGWSWVIGFRESIEAAVIVSVVLAYLRRHEMTGDARLVRWSMALAVGTALLLGAAIVVVGSAYDGWKADVFEGAVTLAAVTGLTWMILLGDHGANVGSREQTDATSTVTGLVLAGLASAAILRESVATAVFLFAAGIPVEGEAIAPAAKLTGAVFGLAVAIGCGVALYFTSVRMNPRTFLRVVGVFLIVITAGMFANVLHEFQEAGWIPIMGTQAYDISAALSDEKGVGAILRGLLGYHADPTWLEVTGWFAFLVVVGTAYVRSLVAQRNDLHEMRVSESQIS